VDNSLPPADYVMHTEHFLLQLAQFTCHFITCLITNYNIVLSYNVPLLYTCPVTLSTHSFKLHPIAELVSLARLTPLNSTSPPVFLTQPTPLTSPSPPVSLTQPTSLTSPSSPMSLTQPTPLTSPSPPVASQHTLHL